MQELGLQHWALTAWHLTDLEYQPTSCALCFKGRGGCGLHVGSGAACAAALEDHNAGVILLQHPGSCAGVCGRCSPALPADGAAQCGACDAAIEEVPLVKYRAQSLDRKFKQLWSNP